MRAALKLIYAFLPQKHFDTCHEILAECNRLFSSFVVGKFIDSSIIGVLCFNMCGDALRDALDPKLRGTLGSGKKTKRAKRTKNVKEVA